jgi:hypothetical protein
VMTRPLHGITLGDGPGLRSNRGPAPASPYVGLRRGGAQPLYLPHPRTGGAQAMDPSDPRTWLRPVRFT